MEPHERKLRNLIDEKGMDPDKAAEIIERQFAEATQLKEIREAAKRLAYQEESLRRKTSVAAQRKNNAAVQKPKPMKPNPDWVER